MAQLQFGDQDARRVLADADRGRFAANPRGENYVGLGDMSFMPPPPPRDDQPPIPVHHPVSDPPTAGKLSPAASPGSELFGAKPESVEEIYPPARGYGNFEGKQDEAARDVPLSGYGGQPDEVPMSKDEGYTSFGIGEFQNSENLSGTLSEEGDNSGKQRESSAPQEFMAKELEDHFVGGGGIAAGTPPLKRESPDFPEGDTDKVSEREVAPPEVPGNVKQQQEDRLQEHEEVGGLSTGASGSSKDEPVDVEGVPHHPPVAEAPEGGSFATGSRGIIDVRDPKGSDVDLPEASRQEPNVGDDAAEGDSKDKSKADDSSGIEAGHAETSHFTSQIKSPLDDPKQRYAVDDPVQELSVGASKQEFLIPDSSEQEHFSELPQEPRAHDSRKEEVSLSEPKPEGSVDLQHGDSLDDLNREDSLDDVKKSMVDPVNEVLNAGPTHMTDRMGKMEAAPQAGLLGNVEQQEIQRDGASQRSFENSQEQGEIDVTPVRVFETSNDEQIKREIAAPDQSAFSAEGPECGSATGSKGGIDVESTKENYADFSDDRPKELDAADNPGLADIADEQTPRQTAVAAEEPEDFSAPVPRGINDVDLYDAGTKEPNLVEDTLEGNRTNEPLPDQSATAEVSEGDFAQRSRGIIDVQSLKEDYVDLSEADTKEPSPVKVFEISNDEQMKRESGAPDQSAFSAEGPERVSATGSKRGVDVESSKEKYADFSDASPKELDAADNPVLADTADELTPRQSAVAAEELEDVPAPVPEADTKEPSPVRVFETSNDEQMKRESAAPDQSAFSAEGPECVPAPVPEAAEEPEDVSAPVSRGINDADLHEAGTKKPNSVEDSLEGNCTNEPPPHQSATAEVAEGDSAKQSRGIINVQPLKEDYVGLSEADTKEPSPTDDSMKGGITNELTHQPVMAEEQEGGSATVSKGFVDVKSLKDDLVDLSTYSEKQPNVSDESVEDNSLAAAVPGQPESGSAQGSRGIIDVQSLKEDYVDLSEAASGDVMEDSRTNEPKVDSSLTDFKQSSSVDDADHVEGNAGPIPESSLDDTDAVQDSVVKSSEVDNRELDLDEAVKPEQSKQPQATDNDTIDSDRVPADDGKEEMNVEGYNSYSGKPENKDLDAVNVVGVEYGKPAHEPEADVAVEPLEDLSAKGGAQPEVLGNMEEDSGIGSEFEPQQCEQARDSVTSEKHEPQRAGNVSSAVEPEGQNKFDAKDVDIGNVSLRDNAMNLSAEEVAQEFSAEEEQQKDVAENVKPKAVCDDAEQSKLAQNSPAKDDERGCERFQGDDGKEKIKAEGFNIYSGKPESTVYNAVDVIGGGDEKIAHETDALKPTADNEAVPEAVEKRDYVPDGRFDLQQSGQAGEFDTEEKHDEDEESLTHDVNVAAVEQDVGLKVDDRNDNIADVRKGEESKDVSADKKAFEQPATDFEQDKSPKVDAKAELGRTDAKELKQAETHPTDDDIVGCEHFQGDDGREKISAGGYNLYSGEPEKTVYDIADVIGDQQEKVPHDVEGAEANVALKPCKDGERKDRSVAGVGGMKDDVLEKGSGFGTQGDEVIGKSSPSSVNDEHVEVPAQHVSPTGEQGAGFQPDVRGSDNESVSTQEDAVADKKPPNTDVFKIESSNTPQGLGFEPDFNDRERNAAAMSKEVDVADGISGEKGLAGEEFPSPEFAHTDDYVKVGYGAENSTPAQNEEVDRQLGLPSGRVGQLEERRSTDEHPLDKPYHLDSLDKPHVVDNVAEQEEAYKAVEEPTRPPSLPHPQREDMVGVAMSRKAGDNENDEQQHHEAGHHKKGIFAKIKEKLSPTFASHEK